MYRFTITKNLLLYIAINICIIITYFFYYDQFDAITILAVIQIIVSAIVIALSKHKTLSVGLVFLVLTFLFNFGQSLITTFYPDDTYAYKSVLAQVGFDNYIKAEIFAMLCIFVYVVGYLATANSKNINISNSQAIKNNHYYDYEIKRINSLAWFVVAISVAPMLYIDIYKLLAYLATGYDATYLVYQEGIGKYFNLIGQFCKPTLCLLIYTNANRKNLARNISIITILYCGVMMFSGDRGSSIIYVITVLFVYYKYVNKIKLRTIIIGFAGAYFALTLITVISLTRSGIFSIEAITSAYEWRSKDGVIYSTLREFGGSIITLCHSLNYTPSNQSFNCGLTYLVSWISVLPKYPEIFNESLSYCFTFTKAFPTDAASYSILGGNYLGEFYFNFGWLSFIPVFFVGKLISKMDSKLDNDLIPKKTALLIILLPSLILWVRDFYSVMLFKTFWMGVLINYFNIKPKRNLNNNLK